jgi:hypothetical protein
MNVYIGMCQMILCIVLKKKTYVLTVHHHLNRIG